MSSRALDQSEARKLLSQSEPIESNIWPGTYNMGLIAEAVNKRRQFVELEPEGKRFSIKYDERAKAVFIKPANNGFAPCGWIDYQTLKEALVSA